MIEKSRKVNESQFDFLGLPAEEGLPCTHVDCERMRKMGMTELKPCPFCGRAVKIIYVEPSGYNAAYFNDEYAVAIVHAEEGCIIDNLMSCNQREESMMIDLWNRRVGE